MKTIAIIPARGGSKGILKKNIIDFLGVPLIAKTIINCNNSKYIEDVYVTSDDDEILKISKKFGAKTIKRPKKLATDNSSSEEALIHALEQIKDSKISRVVFLQATSPLRETTDIDGALETFKEQKLDSLFSASSPDDRDWETELLRMKNYL